MAQLIADRRDIDFVLYEQMDLEKIIKAPKFSGQNKKMFNMIINEARKFGIKEILPLNEEGDKVGLTFEDNKVKVPKSFHKIYQILKDGEYIAMAEDPEYGGLGLPQLISLATQEYITGADFSFAVFGYINHGSGKMIEVFGSEKQKELFLKKMWSGQWGGTMALTESDAGSDIGNLSTTAVKNDDGTYSITGNKIFITCAEHDLSENIINPVLARIEGAPKGAGGISLFLVPKIWVNEDGSLGEPNDVICTGIEEKMGLHASPTCQVSFGSKGKCRGLLLGEENKGMKVMFNMMNEARIGVGAVGMFNASCAYLYALNYARERVQGRDLSDMFKNDASPVPIINHPDVRRMLLWMKSHTEGMRSFVYYLTSLVDRENTSKTDEEKTYINDLLNLLTPILKSYNSDIGFEATVQAMQVFGGSGYTKDYPIERLMRDSKINSIYEGTNGIQAMDLLGRKIGMKEGKVFIDFLGEIQKTIDKAKETDGLQTLAEKLEITKNRLGETTMSLGSLAMSQDFKTAFSHATPFQTVMGEVIMGWMLLWRAVVAKPALEKIVSGLDEKARVAKINKNKNAAFYEGQLKSAEYFIQSILPVTLGKMDAIKNGNSAVVDIPEASFGL
jgi:alkylation response protein AidB-like acyl-CoA dehydrogenase